MRIAVLTSSYPRFPGDGTAPFVQSICEHLVRQGHTVDVVAPYDPEVQPFETGGVRLHRFRYIWPAGLHRMGHARSLEADVRLRFSAYLLLPFFLLGAWLALLRVTGKARAEVIHVHWVLPNGPAAAWAAAWRRIPFVVSLHGSDIFVARRNRLFAAVARRVFRRASAVTACSHELLREALRLGAPEETFLLPWGADPARFHPGAATAGTRRALGVGPQEVLVAAAGRLVHKKGFGTLLEALPAVIERNPAVRLLLAGDGPLGPDLARRVAELGLGGRVILAGRLPWDQVPGLLAAADIFVLPSLRDPRGNVDGLPTVLLEAMSCAAAVVASDIGGVNLVVEDGRSGLLVPPGDAARLAEAIAALACDVEMRRALGEAARRAVETRFNWEAVAGRLLSVFERAIWHHAHLLRLGTIYREEMLRSLQIRPAGGRVLDVGCYDGRWLSSLGAPLRVGVDLAPVPGAPGIALVRADGLHLPFRPGAFDFVFALDVLEHVEDEEAFARSLGRVLSPGGRLFLSTPSREIRLTPGFLTGWVSRQWGHHLRRGFTAGELRRLFEGSLQVQLRTWNAPCYRFFYLPLRFLSSIAPQLAGRLARRLARWDSLRQEGERGFYLLEGMRPPASEIARPEGGRD